MNAALWFWEQSNETMTVRVDCLAGERKPYMTGNDATKYGFDACMYALGVLPPNYPVPAIPYTCFLPDQHTPWADVVRSDDPWFSVWQSDACHIHPVPAPRELAMIPDMWLQCCSDFPLDAIYY